MASFKCRNVGKKCKFEVQADTESESWMLHWNTWKRCMGELSLLQRSIK